MALLEKWKTTKMLERKMDMTIFQTPRYGEEKGYQQVFRLTLSGKTHEEALEKLFKTFNVPDLMPSNYEGRFVATGDIVFIDEDRRGHYYYQLKSGGWVPINRVHVR
ncbi:YodL domain-containing protein [Falsibacillus albus]|uniref:YodL-like protein n=1 Tax=Falsibacillus albus TaxID=2478915 RepID=A0A3L7JY31_9BACI|nr:YodL domain-containing protein [Falsibacillus albus]RLQ95205.1 hypothetical protein D9X91_11980 [Falsibacillus albus]